MKRYFAFAFFIAGALLSTVSCAACDAHKTVSEATLPEYLYKILSTNDWNESQSLGQVKVSTDDKDFIHFSTKEQLPRIAEKYWASVPEYIVLQVNVSALKGNLVFESNQGGSTKYYHLYDGSIPLDAVVGVETISNK